MRTSDSAWTHGDGFTVACPAPPQPMLPPPAPPPRPPNGPSEASPTLRYLSSTFVIAPGASCLLLMLIVCLSRLCRSRRPRTQSAPHRLPETATSIAQAQPVTTAEPVRVAMGQPASDGIELGSMHPLNSSTGDLQVGHPVGVPTVTLAAHGHLAGAPHWLPLAVTLEASSLDSQPLSAFDPPPPSRPATDGSLLGTTVVEGVSV